MNIGETIRRLRREQGMTQEALAQRLEIARRLDRGDSYLNTVEHTGASSATVSRVNRCLEYGAGGYRFILDRLPKLEENT